MTAIVYPISVMIAIAMHFIWTAGLLIEPSAIHATGLHTMLIISQNSAAAAAIFGASAVLACAGLAIRRRWLRVTLLLPQQAALWVSVVGAMNAMALGMFADGVFRTHWFLIVDQIPVVLIALGHTAALLLIAETDYG